LSQVKIPVLKTTKLSCFENYATFVTNIVDRLLAPEKLGESFGKLMPLSANSNPRRIRGGCHAFRSFLTKLQPFAGERLALLFQREKLHP
jgi:hypothetical protein